MITVIEIVDIIKEVLSLVDSHLSEDGEHFLQKVSPLDYPITLHIPLDGQICYVYCGLNSKGLRGINFLRGGSIDLEMGEVFREELKRRLCIM